MNRANTITETFQLPKRIRSAHVQCKMVGQGENRVLAAFARGRRCLAGRLYQRRALLFQQQHKPFHFQAYSPGRAHNGQRPIHRCFFLHLEGKAAAGFAPGADLIINAIKVAKVPRSKRKCHSSRRRAAGVSASRPLTHSRSLGQAVPRIHAAIHLYLFSRQRPEGMAGKTRNPQRG